MKNPEAGKNAGPREREHPTPPNRAASLRAGWLSGLSVGLFFIILMASGAATVVEHVREARRSAQRRQLAAIRQVVASIPPEWARVLSFTAADRDLPAFRDIVERLRILSAFFEGNSIYTLAWRDNTLVFGPESLEVTAPDHSPPGTPYERPPPAVFRVFEQRKPMLAEGFTDEYGTYASVFAPVLDPLDGQVLMVAGLDIDYAAWQAEIWAPARLPSRGMVLMCLIVLGGILAIRIRANRPPAVQLRWCHVETGLVALAGLALTLYVSMLLFRADRLRRERAFTRMAQITAGAMDGVFSDNRIHIMSLVKLIESARELECDAFHRFTALFEAEGYAHSFAWITVDENPSGNATFEVHCSVSRHEAADWPAGYRLDADALRRPYLEKALRTGHPVVLPPFWPEGDAGGKCLLTVLAPVMASETPGKGARLKGIVAVSIEADKLAAGAFGSMVHDLSTPAVRLSFLNDERAWVPMGPLPDAVDPESQENFERRREPSVSWPVFFFDGELSVDMFPPPEFRDGFSQRNGWLAAAGGASLTILMTLFVGFLRSRQYALEMEAYGSLAEIVQREKDLAVTLQSIGEGVIVVDVQGRIKRMNRQAEMLAGMPADRACGCPIDEVLQFINPRSRTAALNPVETALSQGRMIVQQHPITLLTAHGSQRQVSINASPVCGDDGQVFGVVMVLSNVSEKYATERLLRQSEARFRDVAEASGEYIWEVDAKGWYTYVSERAQEVMGRPLQDIIGKTPFTFMPEEDAVRAREVFEHALAGLKPFRGMELQCVLPDGRIIWQRVTGVPFFGSTGEVAGYRGTARDVTAQREAKAAVEKTTEELQRIFNLTPDLLFIADAAGRLLRCNRAWTMLLGLECPEIEGSLITSLVHAEDVEGMDAAIELLQREHALEGFVNRMLLRNGRYRWVEWSAKMFEGVIYGAGRDITETVKQQENLREAAARLDIIANRSRAMIFRWRVAPGWPVEYCTENVSQLGYGQEDFYAGKISWMRMVHPEDLAALDADMQKKIEDGVDEFSHLYRLLTGSNDVRWMEDTNVVLRDKNGVPTHVQGVILDVTDRKQAEQRLEEARHDLIILNRRLEAENERANRLAQEAEFANDMKTTFLGRLQQEVRAPLNGVIGMVDLLVHSGMTPSQRRYLDFLRADGKMLQDLVARGLDSSGIRQVKPGKKVFFDVQELLEDMVDVLVSQAGTDGIELLARPWEGPFRLAEGDPALLRQVLLNLGGNAVKGTGSGYVELSARVTGTTGERATIRFEVRDTGRGIAQEAQARLFDAGDNADGWEGIRDGFPLERGLVLARRLVARMEGMIGCESEEGRGSLFWFEVPLLPHMEAERTDKAWLDGRRFLLVDRLAPEKHPLATMVRIWGGVVTQMDDVRAALESIEAARNDEPPFHVVIVDQSCAGMAPEEFARFIRQNPALREIPLGMISSLLKERERLLRKPRGFDFFVQKPFRLRPVREMLMMALGHSPPSAPSQLAPEPLSQESRAKFRILLAEDHPVNQTVALGILQGLGYPVHLVNTGNEVVRAVNEMDFDLILMDLQMPELDGYRATEIIREQERKNGRRRIPIVALTAHVLEQDRERCKQVGMDGFLGKPVRRESLMDVLDHWGRAGEQDTVFVEAPFPAFFPVERAGAHAAGNCRQHMAVQLGVDPADPMLVEFARTFMDAAPRDVQAMKEAFQRKDSRELLRLAHGVKGAAASVCAAPVQEGAARIEQRVADGAWDDVQADLKALAVAVENYRMTLEQDFRLRDGA